MPASPPRPCPAGENPLTWVVRYTLNRPARLELAGYWIAALACALPAVSALRSVAAAPYAPTRADVRASQRRTALQAAGSLIRHPMHRRTANASPCDRQHAVSRVCAAQVSLLRRRVPALPHILLRKLFHALAIVMFAPAFVLEPGFTRLAFAVAWAALAALELARVGRVPPLGATVHRFMAPFTDSRDAGVLFITYVHVYASTPLNPPLSCLLSSHTLRTGQPARRRARVG